MCSIKWPNSVRYFLIPIYIESILKKYYKEILVQFHNPFFQLKIVYSYVFEVADSEYLLGFYSTALVSKILLFLRIRVTITNHNYCSCMYFGIAYQMQLHEFFLKCINNAVAWIVLLTHIANHIKLHEFYRIANLISPKLEQYCANEVDILNQRPQLHRNTLFLVEKEGVVKLPKYFILIMKVLWNG